MSIGPKEGMCAQCRKGLGHNEMKTFDPRCRGCQDKLSRGLRTGHEPKPSMHPAARKKRLSPQAFATYLARLRLVKANRAA
jgi:hypothetical protein